MTTPADDHNDQIATLANLEAARAASEQAIREDERKRIAAAFQGWGAPPGASHTDWQRIVDKMRYQIRSGTCKGAVNA